MSRKRRSGATTGSLDLLLDTICNTFGGILFISLLVSLMVGEEAAKVADAPAEASMAAELELIDSKIKSAQASLNRTRIEVDRINRNRNMFGNADATKALRLLEIEKVKHDATLEALNNRIAETNQHVENANKIATDLERLRSQVSDAKRRLIAAMDRLEKAEKKNARVIGFPTARTTTLIPVTICIGRSKLCIFNDVNIFGNVQWDPNMVVGNVMLSSGNMVKPNYDRGLRSNDGELTAPMLNRLNRLPLNSIYIQVWVEPDSVPLFHSLSDWAVGNRIPLEIHASHETPELYSTDQPSFVQ
ncbi:hypothetical protein GC170_22475 [bacterium]|nr:hypothetical protein [bacterium]